MSREIKSKDVASVQGRTQSPKRKARAKGRPQPIRYFKGRPVYSEEQTAKMDCPFPDESEWVKEIERNLANRERKKT